MFKLVFDQSQSTCICLINLIHTYIHTFNLNQTTQVHITQVHISSICSLKVTSPSNHTSRSFILPRLSSAFSWLLQSNNLYV